MKNILGMTNCNKSILFVLKNDTMFYKQRYKLKQALTDIQAKGIISYCLKSHLTPANTQIS